MNAPPTLYELVEAIGWVLAIPLTFSGLGALIISSQPGNRVGWLMIIVALAINIPVDLMLGRLPSPPDRLTTGLWLLLWVDNWSWIPVIFPVFLIPLYFPTGKKPSPRWKWVTGLALGLFLLFLVLTALMSEVTPYDGNWFLPNPLGFIPLSFFDGPFLIFWGVGLLTIVSASVISLLIRYRRTIGTERQQIKWLLFAGGVFVLVYAIIFFTSDPDAFIENGWTYLILVLSILGIPIAIAISIFRYRLWDLDVVINRALIYGPLTTVMAGTFAMVIALTTELAKEALGDQSKALGAAISAVIVTVIFQPLRNRIEAFVDKHFYPQKMDLASGLVEIKPEYWGFLDQESLIRLAMEHVSSVLGMEYAAFYLANNPDQFGLAGQQNGSAKGYPVVILSKKQRDELNGKRVVAGEGLGLLVGHVPIFIDRGKSNEILGLLSVGKRVNGRGYSGDDLKGLVELGGNIGLALKAIQMREQMGQGDREVSMVGSSAPADPFEGSALAVR
jgi:hypothetical protein